MRTINRLSAQAVARNIKPGLYSDGGGLYLQITQAGVKSWLFRYMRNGKARGMGIGPLHTVSLADARSKSLRCRQQLLDGIDPLDEKETRRAAQKIVAAKAFSFDDCAASYIETHRTGWKNVKHAAQWESTLDTYASPIFGDLPVATIDTALVMKALEPIWSIKNETATRVRGRIESILDWAGVRGYRTGENPARWKGHLDHLLPKPSKVQKVIHHPALPYEQLPAFIKRLRDQGGLAPLALEFLILTATRTSEVTNARWDEFDITNKVWLIPASRMKAERDHRIPLSSEAIQILEFLQESAESIYVFPGQRDAKPMSNMVFLQLLKRMERTDITVHGFRSTFRDWVGETTNYPREVAEAALAHTIKDKTEAAYARGDLFVKRSQMMQAWTNYVGSHNR
ncbi:tyrosine-type recombinase/integrase [Glaciimonas sp. GS1]|uniref:Tyrosine-type recombinase/integrase n=2 Tax=Glaciimonas soli TaxID=2590999 RepID=A0A843YQH2_9BURK|nr:tyrosine-type recombinase/integrase [Glaciimonas soli]